MPSPHLVSIDLFFWNENFKKKSEDRQLFYSYFIILSIHVNVVVLASESICLFFLFFSCCFMNPRSMMHSFVIIVVEDKYNCMKMFKIFWKPYILIVEEFYFKTFQISDKNVSHSSSYFYKLHYRSMVKNTNYN